MRYDLIVSESILLKAEPTKVWEALTKPEIIKEYLFGTQTVTTWKVGAEIIFQGEYNGTTYKDKGVVLENIPNELLSYSYWSGFSGTEDKPENYSTVIYTIKKIAPGQTEFMWTQKGFANVEGYEHSKSGMKDFLNQIKTIIER